MLGHACINDRFCVLCQRRLRAPPCPPAHRAPALRRLTPHSSVCPLADVAPCRLVVERLWGSAKRMLGVEFGRCARALRPGPGGARRRAPFLCATLVCRVLEVLSVVLGSGPRGQRLVCRVDDGTALCTGTPRTATVCTCRGGAQAGGGGVQTPVPVRVFLTPCANPCSFVVLCWLVLIVLY